MFHIYSIVYQYLYFFPIFIYRVIWRKRNVKKNKNQNKIINNFILSSFFCSRKIFLNLYCICKEKILFSFLMNQRMKFLELNSKSWTNVELYSSRFLSTYFFLNLNKQIYHNSQSTLKFFWLFFCYPWLSAYCDNSKYHHNFYAFSFSLVTFTLFVEKI